MATSASGRNGGPASATSLTIPARHGRAGLTLLAYLDGRGRQWAIQEMVLEQRPEDLEALAGEARACARMTAVPDYDPSSIGADRDRASLFEGARGESRRLGEQARNAAADAHTAGRTAVAATAQVGERPPVPFLIMIMAALVVSMTLSPSLHDQIFLTLRDDLNWAVSLTLGSVIGAMLIWGLIGEGTGAIVSPRAALWGGIIIGIGFAILRLSTAEDVAEVVYACGLSAIEVGTLVFADAVGTRYRADLARWRERQDAAAESSAQATATQSVYARLLAEKAAVDARIWEHLEYADERREFSGDSARRETSCVEAICAGYRRGIAENFGRAQGYGHGA